MGVAPSGSFGLGEFLLRLMLDPLPPFPDFIGETLTVFRDVFKDDFVEQDGHGVEVAGKGVRSHSQRFKWDGAASGKGVHDKWACLLLSPQSLMSRLCQLSRRLKVGRVGRVIPVCKICDEIKQCPSELGRVIKGSGALLNLDKGRIGLRTHLG